MGATNYGSNDIINIGCNLKNFDYEEDYPLIEDYYDQVEWLLKKQHFDFYEIELKGGYYEAFYLDISFKYLWLDNYKEKLLALKETTRLRKFLEECINDFSMVVYYPGWCTEYETRETSLKTLKNAIREQKELIRSLYTEKTITIEKWKALLGIGGNN